MRHSKKSFVNRLNLISQLCRQFKDKPASSFRPHSECTWKSSYKKTASAFCTLLGASVLAAILVLKPSGAQGLTLSKAVKISTFDPFAGCTADNKPAGTFYPNTETEPWIAVNPTNAQNLVAG